MRDTVDIDRELMQRPPILVQWSRANGPGIPFEYAVMAVRGRMIPSPVNSRLPTHVVRSLTNVLRTLHQEEASEESGAWLFARVTSDGVVVRFERAFDSWPPWYQVRHTSQGPSLEDLAWEMAQRTPALAPAVGQPAARSVSDPAAWSDGGADTAQEAAARRAGRPRRGGCADGTPRVCSSGQLIYYPDTLARACGFVGDRRRP